MSALPITLDQPGRFRRAVRGLRALDSRHYPVLLLAWLVLPVIDLVLRAAGLRRLIALLGRYSGDPEEVSIDSFPRGRWNRRTEIIAIAGRWSLGNGTCLRQALLLWMGLRLAGWPARLCIGVSVENGFAAHAWVEVGETAIGQVDARFHSLLKG